VPKLEAARGVFLDEQITAVTRAVVRTAQREQVVGLMIAAILARAQMMHIDKRRVPAARYLAAVPIAQQHRATDGRRNRL
jgi:hypothetical protein